MDISQLQIVEDARPLKILHPITKDQTDIVVYCYSPDSPAYKARIVELARGALEKKGQANAESALEAVKALVEKKTQIIANMISGWEGISISGKPFKYTEKNAIKLVSEFPWIAEQVDKFCGERENFFKGSSKD